jgi:hypothetical protein
VLQSISMNLKKHKSNLLNSVSSKAPVFALQYITQFFLTYIEQPEKTNSIQLSTLSNWMKRIMRLSGIDTTKYKTHSIRIVSGTKVVANVYPTIQAVKDHANWNLNTNTLEKFYYKLIAQASRALP